jgi:hypothetical protein
MNNIILHRRHAGSTWIKRGMNPAIAVPTLLLVWSVTSVLAHRLPHDASDRSGAPLLPGSNIAPAVVNVFDHACANCHSEKTRWPWYSRVAPVSWLIENDVKRARNHLNLSRWDSMDPAEQRMALTSIATVIENREMPPRAYAALHPEARLSVDASVQIIEWTHAERRRLRTSAAASASK